MANSIAGGGMLLVFPALVGLGVPPIIANATSTVALWPGAITSMWGYRDELAGARAWAYRFAVPNVIGGLAGALLLLATPEQRFKALVPWLVLVATVIFAAQKPLVRWLAKEGGIIPHAQVVHPDGTLAPPTLAILCVQFAIAVYGGYFGAGAGILMLGVLGFMGLSNIHQMNGLKNWAALCFNGVAIGTFALGGVVDWTLVLALGSSAAAGGYLASRLAQRVPQAAVRTVITLMGLGYAGWLLVDGARR
ncbi:MAG: sulfite exporter TauE/SafE family protein [Gemmatimonadetes bacterium]|nr:sulfite exporter TauE/SafE family protein [Gemmatimonadota bacterium]